MKNLSLKATLAATLIGISFSAFAGNKDRSGQAGATEMMINPWAQSTGVFGLNTSYVSGVEAMKNNIAGLAYVDKLDFGVSHGVYLTGSQVSINNIGVATRVGSTGVVGVNFMSVGFGDITATDYDHPEGYGLYHPTFLNIQLGFAKEFSNSIRAGVAATYVSENIGNVAAQGLAFDAGVQYVTGKKDNFHFGITLRNLGTNMRFSGTGLSINAENPEATPTINITAQQPADKFQMPTYLNFGAAYDFYLDQNHLSGKEDTPKHRLTVMGDFTSNSFNNDYLGIGVEYSFHNFFMLRAGYRYEKGISDINSSTSLYTGVAAGATVQTPAAWKGAVFALDYSFRPTQRPANGVHMISLRLMLKHK